MRNLKTHWSLGSTWTGCGIPAWRHRGLDATSLPERVTCKRCQRWMRKQGIR